MPFRLTGAGIPPEYPHPEQPDCRNDPGLSALQTGTAAQPTECERTEKIESGRVEVHKKMKREVIIKLRQNRRSPEYPLHRVKRNMFGLFLL